MKLSKTLLQAMVVGMTAGAMSTACTMVEAIEQVEEEFLITEQENCGEDGNTKNDWMDCPMCGLG